jgi:hypothetical protein
MRAQDFRADHELRRLERVRQKELHRVLLLHARHRFEPHAVLADVLLLRIQSADDPHETASSP